MKKYMVADMVKASEAERLLAIEEKAGELEISIEELLSISEELDIDPEELDQDDIDAMEELGASGNIASSMGDIEYQYDPKNDNYVVSIDFARGGSASYALDPDTVFEFDSNGGEFYNSSIRGQM
jgi:hypothetical protein